MDKMYLYLMNCYRFILLGMVLMNVYEVKPTLDEKGVMLIYAMIVLYGIVMSLLPRKKWAAYTELTLIYLFMLLLEDPFFYFLLVVPVITLLNTKVKKVDLIAFSFLFAFLQFLNSGSLLLVMLVGFGLFIGMSSVYLKTSEIAVIRGHVRGKDKEIHEMRDELTERTQELTVISKMFVKSKELNEIIDEHELIQNFVAASADFFNAQYAVLHVNKRGRLEMEEEVGENRRYDVAPRLDPYDILEPVEISGEMIRMPIRSGEELWGVISLYGKRSSFGSQGQMVIFPFNEEDYEMLSVYLEQVKFVMKHAKMLKKMSDLANNDFLTKIPNRRYFMNQMNYLMERAKRGESLSVMILDIDHFKQFNDTYGHDVGDEVLKMVAEAIKVSVRKIDVVGRFGGEEFAVLLPNAKGNELEIAERIRKKIKSINFQRQITVSIGISKFGLNGTDIDELLKKSDKALYRAKEEGRDRIVFYEEEESETAFD